MEEKMEQQSTQDRLPDPDEMYVHLENRLRALGHSLDHSAAARPLSWRTGPTPGRSARPARPM